MHFIKLRHHSKYQYLHWFLRSKLLVLAVISVVLCVLFVSLMSAFLNSEYSWGYKGDFTGKVLQRRQISQRRDKETYKFVLKISNGDQQVDHEESKLNLNLKSDVMNCSCDHLVTYEEEMKRLSDLELTDPLEKVLSVDVYKKRHPNIGTLSFERVKRCGKIPFVTGYDWDRVWQMAKGSNTYHLYSVACDRNEKGECVMARIISMADTSEPYVPYCYFWRNLSSNPIVVRAKTPFSMNFRHYTLRQYPFLINCKPPHPLQNVAGVSISESPCETLTNFLEIGEQNKQVVSNDKIGVTRSTNDFNRSHEAYSAYDVGVCGPALYYYHEDMSLQLVEWLEILKTLKISRVFLYLTNVHPNIEKVMKHYENEGFVKITSFSYPSPYVDDPALRRAWTGVQRGEMFTLENIYFTHCLLANKHRHRYLMRLDPDELPVVKGFNSLSDFIGAESKRYKKKPMNIRLNWKTFLLNLPASGKFSNFPDSFFFLRHNLYERKCSSSTCENFKTIFDTRMTIASTSHSELLCRGKCNSYTVHPERAYTAHYRRNCKGSYCERKNYYEDSYFAKFATEIIENVEKVKEVLTLTKTNDETSNY